jgi:succinyl-CoA synthetase alpha subunit
MIGSDTRVIFQGFTGKQATANAQESIEWGTNIVGGVRPGKTGEHLGLPVLPTVRKAMEELKPHATGIYVAAHQATAAIEEAIEAEIPLIVAVAEHIPLHDILRVRYRKPNMRTRPCLISSRYIRFSRPNRSLD